jgi:hypothetical protein
MIATTHFDFCNTAEEQHRVSKVWFQDAFASKYWLPDFSLSPTIDLDMREVNAASKVLTKTPSRKTHTPSVEALLRSSGLSPKEISDSCQCSYSLVTHVRRRLRLPHARQTQTQKIGMIENELRELRRELVRLEETLSQVEACHDNQDPIALVPNRRA